MYSKICPIKVDFARSYAEVGRTSILSSALYECTVADLGGARGAVAPHPHLPSQEIQKDGCVVIKTH